MLAGLAALCAKVKGWLMEVSQGGDRGGLALGFIISRCQRSGACVRPLGEKVQPPPPRLWRAKEFCVQGFELGTIDNSR
ncbi:MAG: hypothetical protein JWR19_2697 [Pedosphaera sp.]|nr:hypothetical protein [Pedosphaera sp.]